MRFLLDENTHRGLLSFFIRLGHDAKLSPKGLSNGAVLSLAISEKRILVTHDEDFAANPIPSKHSGIILLKIFPRRLDQTSRSMKHLLSKKRASEGFLGKLVLLFEDRVEELPHTSEEALL